MPVPSSLLPLHLYVCIVFSNSNGLVITDSFDNLKKKVSTLSVPGIIHSEIEQKLMGKSVKH